MKEIPVGKKLEKAMKKIMFDLNSVSPEEFKKIVEEVAEKVSRRQKGDK
jgi:hypothetical protein